MYRVRLGCLLGLLAILLVTLAPAVSQVLASQHRLSDALATGMKTRSCEGWFVCFRLYVPTESFFDKAFGLLGVVQLD